MNIFVFVFGQESNIRVTLTISIEPKPMQICCISISRSMQACIGISIGKNLHSCIGVGKTEFNLYQYHHNGLINQNTTCNVIGNIGKN